MDTKTSPALPRPGSEYFASLGKLGGAVTAERYDHSHFQGLGTKGGSTTKARHDEEYYARIGRLGGQARQRKWLAKKKAEAARG